MPAQEIKHQLVLTDLRLSFPKLYKPESIDGGKLRYTASFLFPKDSKARKQINKVMQEIIDAEFGGKPLPADKLPVRDGDEKEFDGYAGNYYLSAARPADQGPPQVVDHKKHLLREDDNKVYPGCYVNAVVRFYALNGKSSKKPNSYGKRICCSLEVVQFARDGEPFGAPKADLDILPDLSGDDDDESDL
jgi:hypothetical protein